VVHGAVHGAVRVGSQCCAGQREARRRVRHDDWLGGTKIREGVQIGPRWASWLGWPGEACRLRQVGPRRVQPKEKWEKRSFSILFVFYLNNFDLNSYDF
jgi:hypothetical protein